MKRRLAASIYALDPEDATDCEKGGCDRIGWIEVDILVDGHGPRSLRCCEVHAGDFTSYMLPRMHEPERSV